MHYLEINLIQSVFQDGRTSMLIFLPNHENDPHLSILSRDLSRVSMRALLANLEETDVLLSIPKFSIESKLNLRSPLVRVSISQLHSYESILLHFITTKEVYYNTFNNSNC